MMLKIHGEIKILHIKIKSVSQWKYCNKYLIYLISSNSINKNLKI